MLVLKALLVVTLLIHVLLAPLCPCRRLANAVEPAALAPHYASMLPSMCALLNGTAGPTRAACERTVQRLLGLHLSLDTAQAFMAAGARA